MCVFKFEEYLFHMGQVYTGEGSWMDLSDGTEWGITERQDCVRERDSLRSRATLRFSNKTMWLKHHVSISKKHPTHTHLTWDSATGVYADSKYEYWPDR